MQILNFIRAIDFAIVFKYIGMLASAFGPVLSIYFWVRLKKRNRMFKIRTATLLKLHELLVAHKSHEVPIRVHIELMEMKIFGVNAYKISVPHLIGGERFPVEYCIYHRQEIPDGEYIFTERQDSIIFDLLEEDGIRVSNVAFSLRIHKKPQPRSRILLARRLIIES